MVGAVGAVPGCRLWVVATSAVAARGPSTPVPTVGTPLSGLPLVGLRRVVNLTTATTTSAYRPALARRVSMA